MKIIAVAGMPGAGKEEFITAGIAAGIPFVRMGDVVRERYAARSEEDLALSSGEFAGAERKRYGPGVWAERTAEKMGGHPTVVDGCRSMDEIRAFRKIGETVVVAIHAAPCTRYERLVKRGRADAPKTLEEFHERDSREISWGAGEVIALSDYMLDNSGSLEDFHARSAELLRSLR